MRLRRRDVPSAGLASSVRRPARPGPAEGTSFAGRRLGRPSAWVGHAQCLPRYAKRLPGKSSALASQCRRPATPSDTSRRRNEPARMFARLLDLVWEGYLPNGATYYIDVVSAYRSPTTDNMLRGRSRISGVAKNGQHTLGTAMHFFLQGTPNWRHCRCRSAALVTIPHRARPFVHLRCGASARVTAHVAPGIGRDLPEWQDFACSGRREAASGIQCLHDTTSVGEFDLLCGRKFNQSVAFERLSASSALATASLPTAKSQALVGPDRQTARQPGAEQPASLDLAIAVPLSTLRSPEIDADAPVSTSAFVSYFKSADGLRVRRNALPQPSAAGEDDEPAVRCLPACRPGSSSSWFCRLGCEVLSQAPTTRGVMRSGRGHSASPLGSTRNASEETVDPRQQSLGHKDRTCS